MHLELGRVDYTKVTSYSTALTFFDSKLKLCSYVDRALLAHSFFDHQQRGLFKCLKRSNRRPIVHVNDYYC